MNALRTALRRQRWWLQLRELEREGVGNAWRRSRRQRAIDDTPPVLTDTDGPIELRILTWRRDWRNAIWALKSFYAFSGVRYPLFIHDGGWLPAQAAALQRHFPNAVLVDQDLADRQVEPILEQRGYTRSLAYRRKNRLTHQLFDFFLLSRADYIIILGSDLLFFRRPDELLPAAGSAPVNRYARDADYFYSMSLDELETRLGVRPVPYFNTGPSLVRRNTLDFSLIERCLQEPKMFADSWVTEQTLHAICGCVNGGADYLPDSYAIGATEGLAHLTCKHYPGEFRRGLYDEGMQYLLDHGFIRQLQRAQ